MGPWRFTTIEGDVTVMRRAGSRPAFLGADRGVVLDPASASRTLAAPLRDAARGLLADIAGDLDLGGQVVPHTSTADLVARARQAVRDGRLVAVLVPRLAVALVARDVVESTGSRVQAQEEKTFVAIELVDTDGAPVPFKRYRIEVTDHSTREGMLDANGRARVSGIDPGTCRVTFPDFHPDSWRAA